MDKKPNNNTHDSEVRKGPWTMEEDLILINYIANHGEGVWNSLARSAGLKRTGKSCRLRWLNYLRPDVRRGNITPEEELLIMELHAKWGNRWSKIAKHLPGRTDNEIKNYWRTRIQKHLKQADQTGVHSKPSFDHLDQASSSQLSMTCESTPSSYTTQHTNNEHPYLPTISPSSTYPEHHHVDQTTYNLITPHVHVQPGTTSDHFWAATEEVLWSMQLFNGE